MACPSRQRFPEKTPLSIVIHSGRTQCPNVVFAAVLFILFVFRFSLAERKNETQMKWKTPERTQAKQQGDQQFRHWCADHRCAFLPWQVANHEEHP